MEATRASAAREAVKREAVTVPAKRVDVDQFTDLERPIRHPDQPRAACAEIAQCRVEHLGGGADLDQDPSWQAISAKMHH